MTSPPAFPAKPLRRLVTVRSSNVDKVMEEGEETVRLCNYVDVYYNDRITGEMELSDGSAKPREIAKFALSAGDVIITKDSETPDDIAVPALVEPSAEGIVCGYHLAILRPRPAEIFGPYLFWALKAKPTREAFGNAAQGVTRYGMTLNGIDSVNIPVPDLDTQRAIAANLDGETARIDQLISKKGRQVTLVAEKFDTLVSIAVTKGLEDSRREFAPSGVDYLGASPADWSIEPLGRRYSVQLGKMLDASRQTGEYPAPYLRVADVQWDEINVEDLPLMDFSAGDRLRFNLRPGDLLVNEGGSYVGRSAIWRGQIAECFYQKALHRVRPRQPDRDSAEFLLWVMWFATKQGVFVARGNQTTIDHLTAEALRRYRFAFPPPDEQRAIACRLREEHEKNKGLT